MLADSKSKGSFGSLFCDGMSRRARVNPARALFLCQYQICSAFRAFLMCRNWSVIAWFLVPLIVAAALIALLHPAAPMAFVLTALAAGIPALLVIRRERSKNARLIARARDFTQNLIDVIPEPVYVKDAASCYIMVNAAFVAERGVSREDLLGVCSMDLAPSEAVREKVRREDLAVLGGATIKLENHDCTSDGRERYQLVMKGACLNAKGEPVIVGANFDLTPWRQAERELAATLAREQEQRQRALDFVQQLIDLIPDPVYLKDGDSRYLMVNESLAAERGRKKEDLVGLTSFDLAPDRETAETSLQEDRAVINGAEITKEQRARAPLTGEDCYRVVIKRRCVDIHGNPVVFGLHHYITRWKVAELEYQHLAQQDSLTGIANRRYFNEEALLAVRKATASGEPLTLAMLDLDHFKQVNDVYGHPVGDEVLAEVVRRSLLCLRRSDLMGRWGGEEFIILLPNSDLEQAYMIADRLRCAIDNAVFQTSRSALNITISCGVAQYLPGDDLDSLIHRADRALYQAKWAGRNRVVRGLPEP